MHKVVVNSFLVLFLLCCSASALFIRYFFSPFVPGSESWISLFAVHLIPFVLKFNSPVAYIHIVVIPTSIYLVVFVAT